MSAKAAGVDITKADIFQRAGEKTLAFVRFSTVAGSKGSADLARDVRGFAVKLDTQEDNWDIVGNNIPVFFIQDAIKFPDLIHAAKPGNGSRIPAGPDGPRQLLGFEGGIVRQCRLKPVCLTDSLSNIPFITRPVRRISSAGFNLGVATSTRLLFSGKTVIPIANPPVERTDCSTVPLQDLRRYVARRVEMLR